MFEGEERQEVQERGVNNQQRSDYERSTGSQSNVLAGSRIEEEANNTSREPQQNLSPQEAGTKGKTMQRA